MDAGRFDRLVRALTAVPTRRRLAQGLAALGLAGTLGLPYGFGHTDAKKKKKCKGKKKKCGKKCIPKSKCCTNADCDGDGICQDGTCILPFCSGKNHCDEFAQCNSGGVQCFCLVTAGTGDPFCGRFLDPIVDDCSECDGEEVCVDMQGPLCSADPTLRCSLPCPDPL